MLARVDYLGAPGALGFIELGRDASKNLWVRTEFTASWAKLHGGAEGLLDEVSKVVAPAGG